MSSSSRSQEVATTLRTEILRGQYRVGERLPSERDLSSCFEINRSTTREALKQLEQLGIIEIQPGGARVLPVEEATLEVLGYLLNLSDHPDPKLLDDYLQVFKAFTVINAQNAVAIANKNQIQLISNIITEMMADPTNRELMRVGWTNLFHQFATIHDNLVMRLIANGLKAHFIERMTTWAPKPEIDGDAILNILNGMQLALKNKDAKKMGIEVERYFDLVRQMTASVFTNSDIEKANAG